MVWIIAETKERDEVVSRASTPNDIRVARELISYASSKFRTMLKEHDYNYQIYPQYLTELRIFINEYETGILFFQDRVLMFLLDGLCQELQNFSKYMAQNSVPDRYGRQNFIPSSQMGSKERFKEEIREANRLANLAWEHFPPIIAEIKQRVPEAFDEPISYDWFRSASVYRNDNGPT